MSAERAWRSLGNRPGIPSAHAVEFLKLLHGINGGINRCLKLPFLLFNSSGADMMSEFHLTNITHEPEGRRVLSIIFLLYKISECQQKTFIAPERQKSFKEVKFSDYFLLFRIGMSL